ncbi:MAG: hypothetical protein M1821_006200 [Bathelium mastoideum]|nr:MAG: hypothetical protein M1821_006200 [Bathelium mastoideum]
MVLVPITPRLGDDSLSKRAVFSTLDLQNSTEFYWGTSATSNAALANFTVYMPADNEYILSMEKFSGMLNAVDCSNTSMKLKFKDEQAFDYARQVWGWVNGNNTRSFAMIAGPGDCRSNLDRQPFQVNNIAYEMTATTAILQGSVQKWTSIAHTYDLHVGQFSVPGSNLSRRDEDKDWKLDFAHDFAKSIKRSEGAFSLGLDSSGSKTTGQFDLEIDVKTKLLDPKNITAKLQPRGVGATAQLKVSVGGDLPGTNFGDSLTVLTFPLDGIGIPDILNIGPTLEIDLGFNAGPISGNTAVTGGANVSIPDNAVLELDLKDPSKHQFSGWNPSVATLPWQADANISGQVQVYAEPQLNIEAKILDLGFKFGLDLKMPYVDADFTAMTSKTGACPSKTIPHIFGVQFNSSIGAQLSLSASKANDDADTLFNNTIAHAGHTP